MDKLPFRQIHLDFHTSEKIIKVGEGFKADYFTDMLKEAAVNSITCFAKCHHGMIYYDTKFSARHPGLAFDLLKEQIEACHAAGIRVPIYISVQFDEYMAKLHPEWLQRENSGKPYGAGPLEAGWKVLCLNSSYVDYIIAQTEEIFEKFGDQVDGFFYDIVDQQPCFCRNCIEDMEEEGLCMENEDAVWRFAKKITSSFKKRVSEFVRSHSMNCSIFFNSGHIGPEIRSNLDWYSHLELESLPSGMWGYIHFPITVSYAKSLGKEYLGMTGRFHKSWADFGGFKTRAALEYECFRAIANGAKCSVGDQLHPGGILDKSVYELIGNVYKQIRQKEEWCENVVPVSEIGVFLPEAAGNGVDLNPAVKGAFRMLSEAHLQFGVIDDSMDFDCFKLILLPDAVKINDMLKEKLNTYLKNGGKLLASYKSGMDQAGAKFIIEGMEMESLGDCEYCPDYVVPGSQLLNKVQDNAYVLYEKGMKVKINHNSEKLASIWNPYFNRTYRNFCSHFQTPVDKDSGYPAIVKNNNIVYFTHPVFSMYSRHGSKVYKQLVLNCIDLLLGEKLLKTNAPTTANINLNYQSFKNRYILHILHYIPERRNDAIETIEDVIPLYNLDVSIKLPQKPSRVYCAPDGKVLDFQYAEGIVTAVVNEVRGHQMVVYEC